MDTIQALFEAFDGAAEVGRAIGKTTEHAALMRRQRLSIPVKHWPALIDAARAKGIDLNSDMLAAINLNGAAQREARKRNAAVLDEEAA